MKQNLTRQHTAKCAGKGNKITCLIIKPDTEYPRRRRESATRENNLLFSYRKLKYNWGRTV